MRTDRKRFYEEEDEARYGLESDDADRRPLQALLESERSPVVVELGCGIEGYSALYSPWVGVDISPFALRRNGADHKVRADWGRGLPFADGSLPFVVSIFVLEHVPDPEAALEELDRVLAPGGVAYLRPAFNVPPWRASGLEYLPPEQLSAGRRLARLTLSLRGRLAWRFASDLLWTRLLGEGRLWWSRYRGRRRMSLRWRPLEPYPDGFIGPDSDAVASIDKSEMAVWFAVRGYMIDPSCGARSPLDRLLARHDALVVRKPHGKDGRGGRVGHRHGVE